MRTALGIIGGMIVLSAFCPVGFCADLDDTLLAIHRAHITLDPATHFIHVEGSVIIPVQVDSFTLNKNFEIITMAHPDGGELSRTAPLSTDESYYTYYLLDWLVPVEAGYDLFKYHYQYEGTLFESAEGVTFSREKVGGEITATISDEGIYLSSAARWLPTIEGAMATHSLTIETPAGIETITQGIRTHHQEIDGRLTTQWDAHVPADGINLVAGRYAITAEQHDDIAIYTYLLEEDKALSDLYIERTRAYLDMYEEMIGHYPYKKFATVENWFPTGYGMPSYTLLGSVVMRLPFIPYTSFGHEICHSWWGNAVFIGDGGNWCEGLTVYCADYHYKELESDDAAREYRRNLLKDYAAYAADGKDLPLTEFTSRHSSATRAVGYGKSMMVFHMLDRLVGREAFLTALRQVYNQFLFKLAGWGDFLDAFTGAGDRDLAGFHDQWLARIGAPFLALESASKDGDRIEVRLSQGAPAYDLQVPIVVTGAGGPVEHVVTLDVLADRFEIEAPGATSIAVDPDYHLFRRLHPEEIEPTLRQVLSEETPSFILPAGSEEEVDAARRFAVAFSENETPTYFEDGVPPVDIRPGEGLGNILINPSAAILKQWLPADVTVSGNLVFIAGKRYSLADYDFVSTAANPHDPTSTDMIVLCQSADRLPTLGRRLGHYGKYSWLMLPAARGEVIKGNWQPVASPLTATFSE